MMNELELPVFLQQQKCSAQIKRVFDKAVICGFKQQKAINLMLWGVVIILIGFVAFQQVQISELKQHNKILVVDSETDISGLPAVPLERIGE